MKGNITAWCWEYVIPPKEENAICLSQVVLQVCWEKGKVLNLLPRYNYIHFFLANYIEFTFLS